MSAEHAPETVNDSQIGPAGVRVPSISSCSGALASDRGNRASLRLAGLDLLSVLNEGATRATEGNQTVVDRASVDAEFVAYPSANNGRRVDIDVVTCHQGE